MGDEGLYIAKKVPVLTTTQRDLLIAVEGMLIFNSTTDQLEEYDGAVWEAAGQIILDAHAADVDAHHSEEVARGRARYGTTNLLCLPGVVGQSVMAAAIILNRIYYYPIIVHTPVTVSAVVIEVTGAAGAGEKARVGIYNADINWQPTALVVASGEIAIDAVAVVTTAITATVLKEGRYLIAWHANGQPTLRAIRGYLDSFGFTAIFGANAMAISPYVAGTYAELADPGTAWTAIGSTTTPEPYNVLLNISVP